MAEAVNYYDVLGAFPEATPSQIRQAYRKAARRWHPDKAHAADKALSEKRFKQVAEAYEVLSDGQKRRLYDLYLRCKPFGYIEFADPEDPSGNCIQVPFRSWEEFHRLFGSAGLPAGAWPEDASTRARYTDDAPEDDGSEPLTIFEWLLAGGVVVALWCIAVSRHSHRLWLEALPQHIWRTHCEYAAPLGLLLSPFFFGTVPFHEAADWMRAAIEGDI